MTTKQITLHTINHVDDTPYNPWVITHDHLEGCKCFKASRKFSHDEQRILPTLLPVKFKLLDDDGIMYYSGRMKTHEFNPLDEYGEPHDGCTTIMYYNDDTKKWETL